MLSSIEATIGPTIEASGFQCYGCEFHQGGGRPVLLVYIDSEQGVSIDDCATVSRQIAAVLDVENTIDGAYELQVSSPGIDRPLLKLSHYHQAVGKPVKLTLRQPRDQQRRFTGVLKQISGEQLTFLLENEETLSIDFVEIEKAKLTVSMLKR